MLKIRHRQNKDSHNMPTPSPTTWRLIVTPDHSGPENMAIDEALLRSFDPQISRPVLRLYGWNPPALSLGRFQKAAEVLDLERCRAGGVAVVRRVTGGGVIYHSEELTYSIVCAPEQIPSAASIKESFRVLTGFLLAFYQKLGLEAAYVQDMPRHGKRLGERTPFCFAGRESFDILVNGRKIGGNAQRRLKGIIFQHGSIPLVNRAQTGVGYMLDKGTAQAEGVTSLAECGVAEDYERLRCLLAEAFRDYFKTGLVTDVLTVQEETLAGQLAVGRYSADSWNQEGVGE